MNPMKPRKLCAAGCGRYGARAQRIYCSTKCQQQVASERRYEQFLNGNYPPLGYNTLSLRKLIVRYIGNEACTKCGWAERHPVTGRIPVEVEHIDGDWRNNKPDNLTLLCPNCHSLTPTFRALNKGRGRSERLGGRANPLRGPIAIREGRRETPAKNRAALSLPERQLALRFADVA